MKAGISGVGSALPGLVITNEDLASHLDTNDEWIFRRTGIRARRRMREGEDVTTLAVAACADALADAGRAAEDVDAIIISTITPDYLTQLALDRDQSRGEADADVAEDARAG